MRPPLKKPRQGQAEDFISREIERFKAQLEEIEKETEEKRLLVNRLNKLNNMILKMETFEFNAWSLGLASDPEDISEENYDVSYSTNDFKEFVEPVIINNIFIHITGAVIKNLIDKRDELLKEVKKNFEEDEF